MAALRTALLLLPLAPAGAASAQEAASTAVDPRIEFVEPPFAVPPELRDSVRFGWLTVPRDHTNPGAGSIRLAVSIIAPRTTTPEPDPIVLLPGGPGSPLVETTQSTARSARVGQHRLHRAIVLLDPRGHGLSEPATCPEFTYFGLLIESDSTARANLERTLVQCRERLAADGWSPAVLNATQAAHDLDMLRRALGAPQLNVIGASYGTRIVAEALREVPQAVRAAMMHGPVPPGYAGAEARDGNAAEVMAALFRRCAAESACSTAFPQLAADYDSVLARAQRSPPVARVPATPTAGSDRISIDAALLRTGLAQLGFSRELAAGAPLLIHTLAHDGLDPLAVMAPRMIDVVEPDLRLDTHLAFRCNDAPPNDMTDAFAALCRAFIGDRFGDTTAAPFTSDIPALVFTGELDPRTPPSQAHAFGAGLTRGTVVIIPWWGHAGLPDCAFRMTDEFLRAPERTPNATCMDSIAPVQFATSIRPSRWVGGGYASAAAHPLLIALHGGAALLLLFVPFLGVPAGALRRRGKDRVERADVALWLVALVGIATMLGTAGGVMAGARQSIIVPALGVPDAWRWVLAMPWLLALLSVAALLLVARTQRVGSRARTFVRWSGLTGAALGLARCAVAAF